MQELKKTISFFVPGPPQGKARARTVHTKGGVRSFTPDKTVLYENLIKSSYWSAYPKLGPVFNAGEALEIHVSAFFDVPKSTTKKNAQLMRSNALKPTKKPDADNIAKCVCDALNKVVYKDDAQVTDLHIVKRYNAAAPGLLITVSETTE